MCFNKEVSLVILIFAIAAAIKMFLQGSNAAGIYIIALSLIQLAEFVLHLYNKPTDLVNKIASVSIYVILMLQIIACIVGMFISENSEPALKESVLGLGIVFLFFATLYLCVKILPNFRKMGTDVPRNNCKMVWTSFGGMNDIQYIAYGLFYLVIVLITTYSIFGDYLAGIIGVLFGFCVILQKLNSCYSIGTMWCFSVIFVSIFVFIFDDHVRSDKLIGT